MKTIQCPQDGVYEEELEVDGGDDDDGGDNDDIGDDDHTYHPLTIADRLDQLTKQLIGKGVATFATFYNICKIFHIKDTKFLRESGNLSNIIQHLQNILHKRFITL